MAMNGAIKSRQQRIPTSGPAGTGPQHVGGGLSNAIATFLDFGNHRGKAELVNETDTRSGLPSRSAPETRARHSSVLNCASEQGLSIAVCGCVYVVTPEQRSIPAFPTSASAPCSAQAVSLATSRRDPLQIPSMMVNPRSFERRLSRLDRNR